MPTLFDAHFQLRGLSLTQPWASLMALGHKRIETRSWATSYTGSIAIQAAKGFPGWARKTWEFDRFEHVLSTAGYHSPKALPLGAIVAIGWLTQCTSTNLHEYLPLRNTDEWHFGNYERDRFMLFFDSIRPLR